MTVNVVQADRIVAAFVLDYGFRAKGACPDPLRVLTYP